MKTLYRYFFSWQILYFIMLAISAMSCLVYNPQMVDVPLINKKGDIRANAGVSALMMHGTVSYGITDKIAIQTYGGFSGKGRYYAQQAVGYYKDLGNKKIMEVYSGFGFGYGDATKDSNQGNLFGNYQVYFGQFNFGIVDYDFAHADFGVAFKTGLLHSKLTDRNYYGATYVPIRSYAVYPDNSLLLEPQVYARLGGEHLKLNLHIGATGILKFTNKNQRLPHVPVNIGIGANYTF